MAATVTFYLESSGTAPISPAYDSGWNQTDEADRVKLTQKLNLSVLTTLTDKTITIPITTTQNILARQFVSDPIPPQRFINPTVRGPVRCLQSATTCNATMRICYRVVSNDGGVVRGTFISQTVNTALAATAATRIVNNATSAAFISQPGDRLVLEYGVGVAAPTTAGTATLRFGSSAASDFANTAGLTTDLNPSINFQPDMFSLPENSYQFVKVGDGMSTGERIR